MSEPGRLGNDDEDRTEIDRQFGEIVAGLNPSSPGPAPEDSEKAAVSPPPSTPPELDPASWRSWNGAEGDDHFTPAPTEPLPAGDLQFWGIVLGLTLGPLLLFLSASVPAFAGGPWALIGSLATIAGFVLLVLRPPRSGPGADASGAQV